MHPNFPGQFKHIAKHFADLGHEVVFLCQTHYNRHIKNIQRIKLKGEAGDDKLNSLKLKGIHRAIKLSQQYLIGFKELDKRQWEPDIIISHSGWGCGTYAKQHWPKAYMVGYLEWWFYPQSTIYSYDQNNQELGLNPQISAKHWLKNSLTSLELSTADIIISPTEWQKNQLPKIFQQNCKVIFDGIDTSKFNHNILPDSSITATNPQINITYGTRGMEPIRCFPQFIRSLPSVIKEFPSATIKIAGNDEINYGGNQPAEGTWKKWALKYLEKHKCSHNVTWLGRLSEDKYIEWLKQSSCHVYLSHPYVASWSLLEAIHCCKIIVASDVEPVREFYNENNMILVDHRKTDSLSDCIIKAVSSNSPTPSKEKLGVDRLSIVTCTSAWCNVVDLHVATSD